MNPKRVPVFCCLRAVVKKEFRQIARDARTLIFLIVMPGFLLLMFGFALNFDVKHVPLAVCDEDGSASSRAFMGNFTHTEYFDLKYELSDPREVDRLLGEEKVRVVLVVPRGFAADLAAGREPAVQVLVDGANASGASTAVGTIGTIVQNDAVRMTTRLLRDRGITGFGTPLASDVRVWYNPELRSAIFLVPGLMAFILMVILVITTAFSVVREKERGTMEQIMVSPLKPAELIIGKTVPYIFISLVSSHLVLLLGLVLFGVAIKGNYLLLLLTMTLFLVGGLGQGLLISTVTRTQQVAFQLAILSTFLPTFILSGFVFPVRNMPPVVQALTYLVPAKYFLVALRSIIIKGAGLGAFWDQLLCLAAFAAMMLGVSTLRMKKAGETGKIAKSGRGRGGRP
jgi:ABC-2 type transport system permease protein